MTGSDEINDMLEEIRMATAGIRATTAQVREQVEKDRGDSSESREDAEEARRNGEQGKDWQTLQQRIDLGQTTVGDIINGVDHSDEASAVRKQLGSSLSQARITFRETEEDSGDFAELKQAQAELARTVARLSEINRAL